MAARSLVTQQKYDGSEIAAGRLPRHSRPTTSPLLSSSFGQWDTRRRRRDERALHVDIMAQRGLYEDVKKGKLRCSELLL
jgi:hypothetical protein